MTEARTKGEAQLLCRWQRKAQGAGWGGQNELESRGAQQGEYLVLRVPQSLRRAICESRGKPARLGQLAHFSEKVTSAANSEEDCSCLTGLL